MHDKLLKSALCARSNGDRGQSGLGRVGAMPHFLTNPLHMRCFLVVVAFELVGCQTLQPEFSGNVVPIYALRSEALAVAYGQFGAVPIAVVGEAEIEAILSTPCAGHAVEVQMRAGRRGWTPLESVPRKLQESSGCPAKTADLASEPATLRKSKSVAQIVR